MTPLPLVALGLLVAATASSARAHPVPAFAVNADGGGRYELTLTGRRFTSRDAIERDLLRRAALLARGKGADWFVLLHMPGESPDLHPPRSGASFGARYGHWQPHWTYRTAGGGWQPWHPEWGAPFWTSDVDPATVNGFEVHAMVELGRGPMPAGRAFDARRVLRDLRRR
jgi:hypothetical protein